MNRIFIATLLIASLVSCDVINSTLQGVNIAQNDNKPSLTNEEVISGLKEALNVGIKNSVDLTSVTDGFLKNESIRLPFPQDAIKVKEKAI